MTGIIRKLAMEVYDEETARRIWQRVDLIGDIAVIKTPFGMTPDKLRPLAERLVRELKYVKSVWAAAGPVEGEYRLRNLVHLAGEAKTETIYREYGCSFLVDITKVYISPRLSYEHYRVASLVGDGEKVVNMYAGAGGFSIVMAKLSSPEKVYSIDINVDAFYYMYKNIILNKVEDVVTPLLGDATILIASHLKGYADRVLMPLPDKALEHLPYAIMALSPAGERIIHVYLHVGAAKGEDPLEKAVNIVNWRLHELGYEGIVRGRRIVRAIGPRRYQVVLDLKIL
ncbi:MAG: class I SAM-dependent methyltransferase family protein [Pyrodictiaceae archaeon]